MTPLYNSKKTLFLTAGALFLYLSFFFFFSVPVASAITWNVDYITITVNNSIYWDGHAFSYLNATYYDRSDIDNIIIGNFTNYVPYVNATNDLDLGSYNFKGKFNWTTDTWNIFDGNSLSRNDTLWNSVYYNRDEVEDLVGGSSLELFFKNTSSGISDYRVMDKTANEFSKNSSTITLSATETFLGAFISPNASDLGISGLDEGIIEGHFHAKVDATGGKKSVEGWFKIYKRNSSGSETFLTSSHIILVDSTDEKEYEAHATLVNETNFDEGDRIVLKMYANLSGSGGDPTLTTYISGNTLARATFGTVGVHFATARDLLNFLRRDGTTPLTDLWNYGSFGINGSGDFTTSGRVGIGVTDPTHTLSVVGDINFTGLPLEPMTATAWFICIENDGHIFLNETGCRI